MQIQVVVSPDLCEALRAIARGRSTSEELNLVIAESRVLATAFVRSKIVRGHLSPERFGLDDRDVAIDCIAELFSRDESGELVELRSYLSALNPDQMGDRELFTHLRRMVFSKVNNGVFRLHFEHDPAFGKIVRNIKLGIDRFQTFEVFEVFGELCISPKACDRMENLPPPTSDILEAGLAPLVAGTERIPFLLGQLSSYLRGQDLHSRVVSLYQFASVVRTLYFRKRLQAPMFSEIDEVGSGTDGAEAARLACDQVKREMTQKYVGRKVSKEFFDTYFRVIEANIIGILSGNGNGKSLLFGLQKHLDGLSAEEYRREHRSILEYLARLTKKRALKILGGE